MTIDSNKLARNLDQALFMDRVRALAAGKMTSTMLAVAIDMGVFQKPAGRRATVEELAAMLALPVWSARVMAQFLCREGLLVYRDKQLANAPQIGPFLLADDRDFEELQAVFKFNLSREKLLALLLDPPTTDGYERLSDEDHFIDVNVRRIIWGEQLAQLYSFKGHRVLLDVAGASGGISLGVRRHNPHLRCILFDQPKAEEFAWRCIREAGDGDDVRFVAGDFFIDDLPRGADVALLSNIIHNWTPEQDLAILTKIHQALEPGGTILVKETYFEDDWTGNIEPVFHAFFMGRDTWQPSYGDVEELLTAAGFLDLERRADIFGLVIGRKSPCPAAPASAA